MGHHLQLNHKQQLLKMCVLFYRGLNFDRHNVAFQTIWFRLNWILTAVTKKNLRELRNTIFWIFSCLRSFMQNSWEKNKKILLSMEN